MSAGEAGRIGAAIILAGLVASIFFGEIALKLAFIVVALIASAWNLMLLKIETAPPIRSRAWGRAAVVTIGYTLPLAILGLFLWFVGKGVLKEITGP